jgi:hypothetical protein
MIAATPRPIDIMANIEQPQSRRLALQIDADGTLRSMVVSRSVKPMISNYNAAVLANDRKRA